MSPELPAYDGTWPTAVLWIVGLIVFVGLPTTLNWVATMKVKATLTKNNSGSHVKDQLDRIELSVTEIVSRLDDHEARLTILDG